VGNMYGEEGWTMKKTFAAVFLMLFGGFLFTQADNNYYQLVDNILTINEKTN
jgi:hypothetical protein